MAVVDRELEALGEEREEKSRRLNLKRMQHISTLQQLSKYNLYTYHVYMKTFFQKLFIDIKKVFLRRFTPSRK